MNSEEKDGRKHFLPLPSARADNPQTPNSLKSRYFGTGLLVRNLVETIVFQTFAGIPTAVAKSTDELLWIGKSMKYQ